ncbi:MAG: hypothetical protein KBT03_03440 [Bacteroidales bacterium]|nr:hypothetical protein [Candidatus Scybalousia scybalohippi]
MQTTVNHYRSISEFYKYICDTPFNEAFRWARHSSVENDYSFSRTRSFEEATELLKNGWSDMAEKLTQKLKVQATPEVQRQMQTVIGVAGFQPIVPLYLAGVPTSMVSRQFRPVKQKVVNITKLFNYSAGVDTEEIIEQSVMTMRIVKKLEAQGLRVNLSIALGTTAGDTEIVGKIQIKGANEKLNVSKLAFPMVHPSMLRRLYFRYIEVEPHVTSRFTSGYGRPISYDRMQKLLPNEVVLPAQFTCNPDDIQTLEQLKASF